mmetsp:Transcript_75263/g.170391  ORF Transcript_75263/g.170391 Transcript_75263/m.170391 type:complete len:85 (-) Transcript_75263:39-293(-)
MDGHATGSEVLTMGHRSTLAAKTVAMSWTGSEVHPEKSWRLEASSSASCLGRRWLSGFALTGFSSRVRAPSVHAFGEEVFLQLQ